MVGTRQQVAKQAFQRRQHFWLVALLGLVLAMVGQPVAAEEAPLPVCSSDQTITSACQLGFKGFMATVANYHPDLQQARIDMGVASAQRLAKQGSFDPSIGGGSQVERFNSSSAEGKSQVASQNSVELTLPTSSGLKVLTGAKWALGDIKTPVSPTGDGGEYYWGVKLPLLRGFLMNDKAAALKQAKIKEVMAGIKYRQKTLELLTKANATYWAWVTAVQQVSVAEGLNQLAAVRLKQIQTRVDLGDQAAIVAVEAQREVAKRQGQLAKANRKQQEKSLDLALYLWQAPTGTGEMLATSQQPLTPNSQYFVPAPTQSLVPKPGDDVAASLAVALKQRPEPQLIGLAQTLAAVDKALATNNLLPQLDVMAIQGVETGNNAIGPVFKAGIQMNIPLRYRTPLGERRQARLTMDSLTIEAQQAAQKIQTDIRNLHSEWLARIQQYDAAKLEFDAAQQLAEGERIRFRLGDTTLFLVNRRERAAADAQLKVIQQRNSVDEIAQQFQLALGNY